MARVGFVVISVVLGAFPGQALGQAAQPAQSATPRFATELVVTPERGETPRHLVPAATAVMDAAALQALPVVQLSELLSHLPGFHIREDHPFSAKPLITARGFFGGGEAEYVLVLLDGIPISDPESGLIDWSRVTTSSIRRVEAFRGPGGSLYGDSAIGGVIQVFTDTARPGGRLTASGGSFGTLTADSAYGSRWSNRAVMATGSTSRSSGPSAHSSNWRILGGTSLDGRIGATDWRLAANASGRGQDDPGPRSQDELEGDRFGSHPLFAFDGLDRGNAAVTFALASNRERWQHRARFHAGLRSEDQVRTILLAPGFGDRQLRTLSTNDAGATLEGERAGTFRGRPLMLRGGLDVGRQGLDTEYRRVDDGGVAAGGEPGGAASGHRWRSGAFTSGAWEPTGRLRVSAGLRWDRIADAFGGSSALTRAHQAWSPRAGVTLQLDRNVTIFGQASRAFKAPTPEQLFDPRPYPDFGGGTFTISNVALEPQRATNVEAGAWGGARLRWSALAYRVDVDNEIDFDVATFSYANIGRSRHTGLELEAGSTVGTVRPSMSYALMRVTDPGGSIQLKNVPRHLLSAAVSVDFGRGLDSHLRYRRSWGAFLDDGNEYPIDGASTIDLRVRKRLGGSIAFLDVLNLTSDRYQQYGFTLSDFAGGIVAYSYPGAPRAVRAGVIASF